MHRSANHAGIDPAESGTLRQSVCVLDSSICCCFASTSALLWVSSFVLEDAKTVPPSSRMRPRNILVEPSLRCAPIDPPPVRHRRSSAVPVNLYELRLLTV